MVLGGGGQVVVQVADAEVGTGGWCGWVALGGGGVGGRVPKHFYCQPSHIIQPSNGPQ